MSEQMTGDWTPYRTEISAAEKALLQKAVPPTGMNYSAVAVATQVVAGTNYRFFCNTKVVAPEVPNTATLVQFYLPIGADTPEEVKITDVPSQ